MWSSLSLNAKAAVIVVGALFLWMLTGIFGGTDDTSEITEKPVKTVALQQVEAQTYARQVVLMARTQPDERVQLSAQVAGQIIAKNVERGAVVQTGELLVQIEDGGRTAALQAAKAQVKATEVLVKAARKLSTEGFKAASTLAERESAYANAKKQLAEAALAHGYTRLTSPMNALVEEVAVEPGDSVAVGQQIVELIGTDKYLITGFTSQKNQGKIKVGREAVAELANGQKVAAKVRFVAKDADADTLTYQVDAEVDGTKYDIPTGMATRLSIPVEELRAHQIPHSALVLDDDGGLNVMTAIQQGDKLVAKRVSVEILGDFSAAIWVRGLPEKALLITRGQLNVVDGEEVRTAKQGDAS